MENNLKSWNVNLVILAKENPKDWLFGLIEDEIVTSGEDEHIQKYSVNEIVDYTAVE